MEIVTVSFLGFAFPSHPSQTAFKLNIEATPIPQKVL